VKSDDNAIARLAADHFLERGLGVDNDEVLCGLSPAPMSSVILNPRRVGRDGAALLSRMMRGETLEPSRT
jgi:hypothetical protein